MSDAGIAGLSETGIQFSLSCWHVVEGDGPLGYQLPYISQQMGNMRSGISSMNQDLANANL
jgi:hypothetical protein